MFNFLKNLNQANEPLVEKVAGEAILKGAALDYNAEGKLVKATNSAKFIAVKDAVADEKINVAPIRHDDIIEVDTEENLKEGTEYDLDSTSTTLATTSINKVFLVKKVGTGKVVGRFVK